MDTYRLRAFLKYLVTEPFIQVFTELKDIWIALSNKRLWVLMWLAFFVVSALSKRYNLSLVFFVLFIFFLITYLWEDKRDEYIYTERVRTFKKIGAEPPNKKK